MLNKPSFERIYIPDKQHLSVNFYTSKVSGVIIHA